MNFRKTAIRREAGAVKCEGRSNELLEEAEAASELDADAASELRTHGALRVAEPARPKIAKPKRKAVRNGEKPRGWENRYTLRLDGNLCRKMRRLPKWERRKLAPFVRAALANVLDTLLKGNDPA